MFGIPAPEPLENAIVAAPEKEAAAPYIPGLSAYNQPPSTKETVNLTTLDTLLEKEKQHNKTEPWNKLDKTAKIQKLHSFAEKYGRDQGLPMKEIKHLKMFFVECLDKSKLQKTKDVVYDKETREVTAIPSLHYNVDKRHFTLRILDTKRVSTLKSLTPKRPIVGSSSDWTDPVQVYVGGRTTQLTIVYCFMQKQYSMFSKQYTTDIYLDFEYRSWVYIDGNYESQCNENRPDEYCHSKWCSKWCVHGRF